MLILVADKPAVPIIKPPVVTRVDNNEVIPYQGPKQVLRIPVGTQTTISVALVDDQDAPFTLPDGSKINRSDYVLTLAGQDGSEPLNFGVSIVDSTANFTYTWAKVGNWTLTEKQTNANGHVFSFAGINIQVYEVPA